MKTDVPLHNFRHQAVQRTAASGHELKHVRAFFFQIESACDGVDLSSNAADTNQKFFLVCSGMSHEREYTIREYSIGRGGTEDRRRGKLKCSASVGKLVQAQNNELEATAFGARIQAASGKKI